MLLRARGAKGVIYVLLHIGEKTEFLRILLSLYIPTCPTITIYHYILPYLFTIIMRLIRYDER